MQRISPSAAILISTPSSTFPTVPALNPLFLMSFTEITGEVSVKPYPSITGIPAAVNTLVNLGCNAALPDTNNSSSPPSASCHFEKINLRAILSWNS